MENSVCGRDYNSGSHFKSKMYDEASKKLKVLLLAYAVIAIVDFLGILDIVSLVFSIVSIVMLFKLGENSDYFRAAAKLTIASVVALLILALVGAYNDSIGFAVLTLVVTIALAIAICWKEFDGMADLVEDVDHGLYKKWKTYRYIYILGFTLATVGAALVMTHMVYSAQTIMELTQAVENANAMAMIMKIIALLIDVVKCALIFMEIKVLENCSQNLSDE